MNIDEIATKGDILKMKEEIIALIKASANQPDNRLMNLQQACAYLGGMKEQTLRQKCCSGEIASHKAGGLKFSKADLDEYIASCRRKSLAELDRIARM